MHAALCLQQQLVVVGVLEFGQQQRLSLALEAQTLLQLANAIEQHCGVVGWWVQTVAKHARSKTWGRGEGGEGEEQQLNEHSQRSGEEGRGRGESSRSQRVSETDRMLEPCINLRDICQEKDFLRWI